MASKDQTYDSIALARVCQLIEWLKDVAKGRGDVRPPDLPHDNPLDEKHALIFSYAQKSAFEVSDTIKELQKQQTQDPRRMQVAIQQQDQHQIQDSQQQSKASSVQESSVNRSPSSKNVDKEAINNLQEQLREQNFKFEETKKALSEEIHSLKTEKDNLMARMSKMGPRKVTYRNPSICDLIHPPRPQSVAEQYEELYDSEWTDAMELFNPIGDDKVEQQSIGILADILKFCYDESEKVADQQLSKMRTECFSLTSQENPQRYYYNTLDEAAKRHLLYAQHYACYYFGRCCPYCYRKTIDGETERQREEDSKLYKQMYQGLLEYGYTYAKNGFIVA